jgi:hypothetical protein
LPVADPVDHTVGVIPDQQRPVARDGEANGPAESRPPDTVLYQEAVRNGSMDAGLPFSNRTSTTSYPLGGRLFQGPRMVTKALLRYSCGN